MIKVFTLSNNYYVDFISGSQFMSTQLMFRDALTVLYSDNFFVVSLSSCIMLTNFVYFVSETSHNIQSPTFLAFSLGADIGIKIKLIKIHSGLL